MPPGHNAPGQNSPGHNAPGEDKMPRRIKTKVELKSYYLVQDFLIFRHLQRQLRFSQCRSLLYSLKTY